MRAPSVIITALVGLIGSVSVAHASLVTYITPPGSMVIGNSVSASATFTTPSPGTLIITLTNSLGNPGTITQTIGDLDFTLSSIAAAPVVSTAGVSTAGISTVGATLASSSGQQIKVNDDGTFTTPSTVSTGWTLTSLPGSLELSALGPENLIIGPPGASGTYSNADETIAGSGNPFLSETATFAIDITSLATASLVTGVPFSVTSATFSFGAGPGLDIHGVATPLPAALPLFATGIGGLGLLGWRRKRKARAVT